MLTKKSVKKIKREMMHCEHYFNDLDFWFEVVTPFLDTYDPQKEYICSHSRSYYDTGCTRLALGREVLLEFLVHACFWELRTKQCAYIYFKELARGEYERNYHHGNMSPKGFIQLFRKFIKKHRKTLDKIKKCGII